MCCSLAAGTGSKSTAMYQIKYASKESVEISASGSMLLDAHAHNKEYASAAEDAGTEGREARRFAQRVINSAAMELEAVQAAGVVLGMGSSGSSDEIEYYSAWDARKLARIVADGVYDDVDFSIREQAAERDRAEDTGYGGGGGGGGSDDDEPLFGGSDGDDDDDEAAAARGAPADGAPAGRRLRAGAAGGAARVGQTIDSLFVRPRRPPSSPPQRPSSPRRARRAALGWRAP